MIRINLNKAIVKATYSEDERKNMENVLLVSSLIYCRDYILPRTTKKKKRKAIELFLGGDWFSSSLLKRLVYIEMEPTNINAKAAFLMLIFTGWSKEYLLSIIPEDMPFLNYFNFKSGIKACAQKTFARAIENSNHLKELGFDEQYWEDTLSNVLAVYNFKRKGNLDRAKRTFLYYSIFKQRATFEEVIYALNIPDF